MYRDFKVTDGGYKDNVDVGDDDDILYALHYNAVVHFICA